MSTQKIAVRYYTKSGNTKRLADAIARAAGVKAETVDVPVDPDVDLLFLGSSVYAAGADEEVKTFISRLDPRIKRVVHFGTAAILTSTYGQVRKLLAERKIPLDEREFHCKGSFKFMHKGKPDAEDIRKAGEFAKSFLK